MPDELVRHTTGVWYRPGTTDEDTFALVRNDYKHLTINPGDVVLDLGANIGIFAAHAYRCGASTIICVEPEKDNYGILLKNFMVNKWPVIPYGVAVGDKYDEGTLYVSVEGKGRDNHSLYTKGRKVPQKVAVYPIDHFLEGFHPNVIKCDIEYGEYSFLERWAAWPDYVKRVSAELHLQKGFREKGAWIADAMEAQGFRTLRKGTFNTKGWHTICTWERD